MSIYPLTFQSNIMIQTITIPICICSIIWSLFQPMLAWIPLFILAIYLLVILAGLKSRKPRYIEELSTEANEMFQKYSHFYVTPNACRDSSSTCSTVQFSAVILGVVGIFNGFTWGIGLSTLFWFVLSNAAKAYNPTFFIQNDPVMMSAHDEIIEWITTRRQ